MTSQSLLAASCGLRFDVRSWLRTGLLLFLAGWIGWASPVVGSTPSPPRPPYPESHRYCWTFDQPQWWDDPRGTALVVSGAGVGEGLSGASLVMAGEPPALVLLPQVDAAGMTNFSTGASAWRVWVRPHWSAGEISAVPPFSFRRLLELGTISGEVREVWWSLYSDGSSIYFSGQVAGRPVDLLSASFPAVADEWMLLVLSLDESYSALYVNSQLLAKGAGVPALPADMPGTRVLAVGSSLVAGNDLAEADFDDLTTFDAPCSPAAVAACYEFMRQPVVVAPYDPVAARLASELANSTAYALSLGENLGCALWLEISPITNNEVPLTLHNTTPGRTYQIRSREDIAAGNWTPETNVVGASGQDFTQILLPIGQRTSLFLDGTESRDYTVDTNSTFQGLNQSHTESFLPADTMGAAGPNHFVELLNGVIAVFPKTNGSYLQITNNFEFFHVEAEGTNYPQGTTCDGRILYDHHAARWVACAMDFSASWHVILAVSKSSDPLDLTNNWDKYLIPVGREDVDTDYTTMGLDANGIYLSVTRRIRGGSGINSGHTVVAIKKPEIYTNAYSNALVCTFLEVATNDLVSWCIQPAVNFDSTPDGGYAWFVAKGPPDLGGTYQGGAVYYRRLEWAGTSAQWVGSNWQALAEPPMSYRDYYDFDGSNVLRYWSFEGPAAPQLDGPGINLMNVGNRLMMATIRNGSLWTCQHVGLAGTTGNYVGGATDTNVDRSAMQWLKLKINTEANGLIYDGHGRIFDRAATNAFWYYFPSLAVNCAGDMVAGFSGSSTTTHIGAFCTWRLSSGFSPDAPVSLKPGSVIFNNTRWGDYSATCVDPTDAWTFWTVQQYAEIFEGQLYPWATWISKIRLCSQASP